MGSAAAMAMRHSRSLPSVATPDWAGLATPRNLIEVSARLRSSQEDLRRLEAQRSSGPLHRSGYSPLTHMLVLAILLVQWAKKGTSLSSYAKKIVLPMLPVQQTITP